MSYRATNKKRTSRLANLSRPALVIGSLVIIAALVVTGLELTNTTHFFHKAPLVKTAVIKTTTPTKSQSVTKDESSNTTSPTTTNSADTTSSGGTKDTIGGTSSAVLIAPSGDFVSDHSPKLGETEVSVCNTTPGAQCTITFTMGSTTRSLSTQTADNNGSATWTWTVDDSSSGFAPGSWQITVTAELNGQTSVITDSRPMEVSS